MTLGETIRLIRKQKKIQQKVLANRTGISAVALNRIECSISIPKNETLKKIAQALDVSMISIMWRMVDVNDIIPDKREMYLTLKPYIDQLIKDLE